jgi:pimeloyl-ACP methyl ester carboxylesterase
VGAPTFRRLLSPPALLIALALLATACTPDDTAIRSAALEGSRPVSFDSVDGTSLEGRLFGPSDATAGVVLSHMLPADQSSWFEFAHRLGDAGYLALTYDFRGYCPGGEAGCSQGEKDIPAIPNDVAGAIEELRSRGVQRLALIGASMGGTASLVVASQPGADVSAVITLSAPATISGLAAGPDVLATVASAKLFIAGTGDTTAAQAAQDFYNQSLQPKRYELLTTDDHGTDLLEGNQGEQTRNLILDWLDLYVPAEAPQQNQP